MSSNNFSILDKNAFQGNYMPLDSKLFFFNNRVVVHLCNSDDQLEWLPAHHANIYTTFLLNYWKKKIMNEYKSKNKPRSQYFSILFIIVIIIIIFQKPLLSFLVWILSNNSKTQCIKTFAKHGMDFIKEVTIEARWKAYCQMIEIS